MFLVMKDFTIAHTVLCTARIRSLNLDWPVGALTGFGGAVAETGSEIVTWSSRSHRFAVFRIFEPL